jgi:hypothetical protein
VKGGDQRDAAGTPGFAAPESFLEQEATATTDVYGLAATMYCALTGRPPFGSGPAPQVVQRQLNDPLPPPSTLRSGISQAVDAVLAKALSPHPKKRWASASTFAIALGRALERGSSVGIKLPPVEEDVAVQAAEAVLTPTEGIESISEIGRVIARGQILTGRVRAAHLRVLSRMLQHHIGESGMAKIIAEVPDLAASFSPTLAPLSWIDLADLVNAFQHTAKLLPNKNVPRKIGRGTMSATFARLFGADPSSLAAETVLAALPTFWPRYHDWGDAEVAVNAGHAVVILTGNPGSTEVCDLVASELERIVELTGIEDVTATHDTCRCKGGNACEYQLRWTRPAAAR